MSKLPANVKENLVKLDVRTPADNRCGFDRPMVESLWAEDLGNGAYRLRSIPACEPDLNMYDIVYAQPRVLDGLTVLEVTGIAQRGGQRTFDIFFADPGLLGFKIKREQKALLQTIREDLGGETEKFSDFHVGISIPYAMADQLRRLLSAGLDRSIDAWGESGGSDGWSAGRR